MSTALALPPESRTKLAQLIRLLESNRDGEVLAAARAIGRTLRAVGKDFHDLALLIEGPSTSEARQAPATPWSTMAAFCAASPHLLNPREFDFINNMSRLTREPTAAQEEWLIAIYEKLWRKGHR